jgi:hypothetical protein
MMAHLKAQVAARNEDRKDADIANKIDVSQRETEMLEKTPIKTVTGSVAPR